MGGVEGGDDLDEDRLGDRDGTDVVAAEMGGVEGVRGESLQEVSGEDGARALADDVNDALDGSERLVDLGNEEGDGDSRVQVSTRDVSRGEDEHHDRQTERKRDRVKSAARGDGSSAAGENEEEYANGLRTSSADEHLEIFAFAGHQQIRTM